MILRDDNDDDDDDDDDEATMAKTTVAGATVYDVSREAQLVQW